jgi:thiol-disulfide isomerase/thioredoxin
MRQQLNCGLIVALVLTFSACSHPRQNALKQETTPKPQIVDADDSNFQQTLDQAKTPVVLVDVWAAWCAPCRAVKPLVEEAASQYAGKLTVIRVDADKAGKTADRYAAQGLPTITVLNRACSIPATNVGFDGNQQMRQFIAKAVNSCPSGKPEKEVDRSFGPGLFLLRGTVAPVYTSLPANAGVKQVQDAFDVYVRQGLRAQDITKPTHKQLAGAYADLQSAPISAADPLLVAAVQPHSAAARAGIQPGDRVTAIDGIKVDGTAFMLCTMNLQGTLDSPLKLSIERSHGSSVERIEVSLTRGKVDGIFD